MPAPKSVTDVQLQSLVELVEAYRDDRCGAILDQARAQCERILGHAFAEARERVAEAVAAERADNRRRVRAAEARLQTHRRQARHRTALLLLRESWDDLRTAVEARWQTREGRQAWVHGLTEQAAASLPAAQWRVEHPPDWDPEEGAGLCRRAEGRCGTPPEFAADGAMTAGLRIHGGKACLDGTVNGLLADRAATEARLLAHLGRLLEEEEASAEEGSGP